MRFFGIKVLLALHVFAVMFLITGQDNAKRSRQLTGVVISGVVILIPFRRAALVDPGMSNAGMTTHSGLRGIAAWRGHP